MIVLRPTAIFFTAVSDDLPRPRDPGEQDRVEPFLPRLVPFLRQRVQAAGVAQGPFQPSPQLLPRVPGGDTPPPVPNCCSGERRLLGAALLHHLRRGHQRRLCVGVRHLSQQV